MIVTNVEFEKIDNVTVGQSIIEIAQRSTKNEAESGLEKAVSHRAADAVYDHHNGRYRGEEGQQG